MAIIKLTKKLVCLISVVMMSLPFAVQASVISSGTNITIPAKTVTYQTFSITRTHSVDFSLTGLPSGSDSNANAGINYWLLEGIFGGFGAAIGSNEAATGQSFSETFLLPAGIYTFAIGSFVLNEPEARTGSASTPGDSNQAYNFSIAIPIPAPATVILMGLGMVAGIGSIRKLAA